MIITVTMNPSMDYSYAIPHFQLGATNRFQEPIQSVGGKGINAGRTAALSGSQVMVTGFLAGDQGELVSKYLKRENLFTINMIKTTGQTRNAISIMHDNGTHTEIVEEGPQISDIEVERLITDIERTCAAEEVELICISGSINSENQQIYSEMLRLIRERISETLPVMMDISGEKLAALLRKDGLKPSFIKPNIPELADILDKPLTSKAEALQELSNPLFDGIDYIMISCGSEGSLCRMKDTYFDVEIPKIDVRNTTGSGDASVGGFMHALVSGFSEEDILKYSMACGMSNAQHGEVGIIDPDSVKTFCEAIKVTKIEVTKQIA